MRLLLTAVVLCLPLVACGKSEIAPEVGPAPVAVASEAESQPNITEGQELLFVTGSLDEALLKSGWSSPEDHGTWSQAPEATILLSLPPTLVNKKVALDFVVTAFTDGKVPKQVVTISANDAEVGQWTFEHAHEQNGNRSVELPEGLIKASMPLTLKFSMSAATSPSSLGIGADTRQLGVHLRSLKLRTPIDTAPSGTPNGSAN
ncbi:MAG: hypothetical protein EOP06_04225 [Proteobacteria bacterium]|nr:MAG: hypothetical protein EOP06_04225 [Pseudomonadota bacterium]